MLKLFSLLFVICYSLISADKVPITLGYYPSWSENFVDENSVADSYLAQIPSSVSHIFLAFAKPDLQYTKGSYDLSKTGLELRYDGRVAKRIFQALKDQGTKVLLSIGGESYWSAGVPATINYQQIADLVKDLGLSGIDWDFEPRGTFDTIGEPENVQHFIKFIRETRKVLPRDEGFLIAVAPAGCGALGGEKNDDNNSPYKYGNRNTLTGQSDAEKNNAANQIALFGYASTGHMIPVFSQVGNEIDIVAYQGYNVGGAPDRYMMYLSYAYYASIHGFSVAAGVHMPNEPWFYYASNASTTAEFAKQIFDTADRKGKGDGMMVWQLLLNSQYPGESDYTGKSYLTIARNIFNGQSVSEALKNAFNYSTTSNVLNNNNPSVEPSLNSTDSAPGPSSNNTGSDSAPSGNQNGTSTNNSTANILPWSATEVYKVAGIKVTYKGRTYESKWWTLNNPPDVSENWRDITPFDENNIPKWNVNATYDKPGYTVHHKKNNYKNKWWTRGDEPGASDAWEKLSK